MHIKELIIVSVKIPVSEMQNPAEGPVWLKRNYILHSKHKQRPDAKKYPSSMNSNPSTVNNGQITNGSSSKKIFLKRKDLNESRECTHTTGPISQRHKKQASFFQTFCASSSKDLFA